MQWRGRRASDNVDDQRGMGGPIAVGGGLIGIIVLLVKLFTGGDVDVSQFPQSSSQPATTQRSVEEDTMADFVKVVLADTEDTWTEIFNKAGESYRKPRLTLFTNAVQSGCGGASAATGPFYCPADSKVYIDLAFYADLRNRFHAGGDFAMAYVVAHEVGHHVQNLLGTSDKMNRLRGQLSEAAYNKYSVMLELQADFFAGVWAHYQQNRGYLDINDIGEALTAAEAIGDDKLQKEGQGYVVPESFTHGTSAQRMFWFKKGYSTGDINQGNTFSDPSLQ